MLLKRSLTLALQQKPEQDASALLLTIGVVRTQIVARQTLKDSVKLCKSNSLSSQIQPVQ